MWDEYGGQTNFGDVHSSGDFDQFTGLGGASGDVWVADGIGSGRWTNRVDPTGDLTQFTGLTGASNYFFVSHGPGASPPGHWEYASWLDVGEAGPTGTYGSITVNLNYPLTGTWKTGTVHILAWNNKELEGYTIYHETHSITDLRLSPSFSITNSFAAYGDTWWYVWMDTDGSGRLNIDAGSSPYAFTIFDGESTAYIRNMTEPAALAEHMPLSVTANANSYTVECWMVDWKGNTPRFLHSTDGLFNNRVFARISSIGGSPTSLDAYIDQTAGMLEPHWIYKVDNAAEDSIGGWGIESDNDGYPFALGHDFMLPPEGEFFTNNSFVYGGSSGGLDYGPTNSPSTNAWDAVQCVWPTGTITTVYDSTNPIVFAFSNVWLEYGAINLAIWHEPYSGSNEYDYQGYVENEHWDTGITYHKARGFIPQPGTNYAWRARSCWGQYLSTNWTRTPWPASYEQFMYSP